ncbi:claspin isoform X2 [Etheostoma cragini]|uniref:claspin isoform X2 n=1 Tax=Etheostoma cragini TaxID=417921 RepID=UPI00155E0CEC|nr:claspin isoform X2 [Etheostoma cragini]
MDPDSVFTRVERTFWTAWYYITGAVNRFIRPEPVDIASNDIQAIQGSAVDSEPVKSADADGDVGRRGVDEEQPLATSSLISSSRPLVAGEVCTTEINLRPDEESVEYTIQPNRISESKATEEGEGTREEQFARARNDDDGLLVAKEDKQDDKEDNGDQKLPRQDETPENEHTNTRSQRLTDDAMCEDMEESERNAGNEEVSMTVDDHQKMDEIIPVKEEDDKMQHDHKPDLVAEDIEVQLCTIKDFSIKEEDDMHIKGAKLQRNEADTAVTHEEEEYTDSVQQLASQNEKKSEAAKRVENQLSLCKELSDEGRRFRGDPGFTSLHVELQTTYDKSGSVSEEEVIVVEQEHLMEDEGAVIEEENSNGAATNQTKDEAPEQEGDIRTVTEDREEEQNLVEHEVTQNAETEPHTAEFSDGEQGVVAKDAKVQTTTREADVETESPGTVIEERSDGTEAHISIEERLSSKVHNKENIMEIGCMSTSATKKTEGEAGQEMTEKLKNIPLGLGEGRVVVSPELNSPTCEETEEGVPEYNNEPGPGENATQRFLEEGDCEEIQGSQLPEEVESKEPESLQNSGFSTGADYLLVREQMEEKQESPRDIKGSFETGLPQESEKPLVEVVIQESGHLFVEEEGELLVDLMKTGIEHLRFESDVGLPDESVKAQDGPEGLLVEFEIDKELHDSNIADAAGDGSELPGDETTKGEVGFADETFLEVKEQKMTVTRFFQESVDAVDSELNCNMTPSSLVDITKSELLKQLDETEPELREDVEMQDAGIHMEEDAAEDEKQNKNEMAFLHLQVAGMADSESYRPVESLHTEIQLSDEAWEISNEEVLTEAAGESKTVESKPKDLTSSTEEVAKHVTESEASCAEETVCSISGYQDVIDEEILDLWLQTALSEDTGGIKHQEGPEPRRQMEPLNQEQDEISSVQPEKDEEQFLELNSKESELVSDTEKSSSTVESGFLDQSLCEWGIHNSETQLLKTSSAVSLPGIYNMLANMSESANIPELSPQDFTSGSLDKVMEKVAETAQSYLKEEDFIRERGFHLDTAVASPEARHLNQELQEKTEEVDTQTGSEKEVDAEVTDWTDTKEAEFKPMTEMTMRMFRGEKPKAEDEPLEITLSDSLDQIKHIESGQPRSSSESLFEEEIVLTHSGLQGDTCTESKSKLPSLDKPQPGWSEDIAESFPGLNTMEVAEQPTTESKDLMEVDTAALDFSAQRSRISVKNPRVRPPKDPRSLLHKPSVDPTPSSHLSAKVLAGVPLRGLGIGIKLPGLGAGFPVLKKTQRVVSDENSPETLSQETKPEEKSDSPKQDEAQPKPKWMTPRHPGFGNPLMSELKTKLKKTTKE